MLLLKHMIGTYISIAVLVLIVTGLIYGIYENRYMVDLLSGDETEKLKKLGIEKLELKRYARTQFSFSLSKTKRQLIPLNSYDHNKAGLLSVVEDELEVTGCKRNFQHTIYKCPYSEENKKQLLAFIESYNNESLQ